MAAWDTQQRVEEVHRMPPDSLYLRENAANRVQLFYYAAIVAVPLPMAVLMVTHGHAAFLWIPLGLVATGGWALVHAYKSGHSLGSDGLRRHDGLGQVRDCIPVSQIRRVEWRYHSPSGLSRLWNVGPATIEVHFTREDGEPDVRVIGCSSGGDRPRVRQFVNALVDRADLTECPYYARQDHETSFRAWERPLRPGEIPWSRAEFTQDAAPGRLVMLPGCLILIAVLVALTGWWAGWWGGEGAELLQLLKTGVGILVVATVSYLGIRWTLNLTRPVSVTREGVRYPASRPAREPRFTPWGRIRAVRVRASEHYSLFASVEIDVADDATDKEQWETVSAVLRDGAEGIARLREAILRRVNLGLVEVTEPRGMRVGEMVWRRPEGGIR
jgi:hypothetical protein